MALFGTIGNVIPKTTLPSGSVLQVVQATDATDVTITAINTWTDSNLSASITPSSTSSKIFIQANLACYADASSVSMWFAGRIVRDSTPLWTPASNTLELGGAPNWTEWANRVTWVYLDSPSTTSSVTYKIQFLLRTSFSNTIILNSRDSISTMVLMEIAG